MIHVHGPLQDWGQHLQSAVRCLDERAYRSAKYLLFHDC